jgi:uncharacterized membrane protein YhaH (DUF805 family)
MAIGQWFSFQGRIGRKTWWLGYVLPLIGISILATVLDIALGFVSLEDAQPAEGYAVQTSGIGVFGIVALVLSVWGGLAGQVKRWHDRDKSGWFVLVNFIPLVGAIWVLVEVGFLRGTAGPNRFGPDPIGGAGAPQWQPGGPPQGWHPQGPMQGPPQGWQQQPAQPQWQPPPQQGWQAPPQGWPPAQGQGAPPPGYGAPPPGYGQPPPGYGQPPPGYGQPPPGYGQPPAPPPGPWTGPGSGGSVPPVRRD